MTENLWCIHEETSQLCNALSSSQHGISGDQSIVYSALETNEDQLLHYEEEIESVEMRLCKNSPGFEYRS